MAAKVEDGKWSELSPTTTAARTNAIAVQNIILR